MRIVWVSWKRASNFPGELMYIYIYTYFYLFNVALKTPLKHVETPVGTGQTSSSPLGS